MKACGYCGRENDEQAVFCRECGTPLSPNVEEVNKITIPDAKFELNARGATFVLLSYLGVQVLLAVFFGVIAGLSIARVKDRTQQIPTVSGSVSAVVLSVSGVAMLLMSWSLMREQLSDTTSTGPAWVVGSLKHLAQGLGAGALMGCFYCALAIIFYSPSGHAGHGPLARMALTPGLQQSLWLLMALVIAPVIEEMLFRGVLYAGYRRSLGPVWAAVLSTSIFWVLHITEMIYFLPSMFCIAAMALVALWLRLRSAAIGPAVACHFGYNAILALIVICWTFR